MCDGLCTTFVITRNFSLMESLYFNMLCYVYIHILNAHKDVLNVII